MDFQRNISGHRQRRQADIARPFRGGLRLLLVGSVTVGLHFGCTVQKNSAPASEAGARVTRTSASPRTPTMRFAALQAPQVEITAQTPKGSTPLRYRIGGTPDVPADFRWPDWGGAPLSFLAQFALEDLPRDVVGDDLPEEGTLSFFYDGEQRTWGFDPKDRGSWRVYYFPPELSLHSATVPHGARQYSPRALTFGSTVSYADETSPVFENAGVSGGDKEEYLDFLVDHVGGRETMTTHRLLGHAYVIQGYMELGCQLASNGIDCGTPAGYESDEGRALASGAKDWRLLFQLDSDVGADMMWGDSGRLYFWIRTADLKARAFDKVWMKLECY